MFNTERVFLILILVLGGLLFYILSLFFQPTMPQNDPASANQYDGYDYEEEETQENKPQYHFSTIQQFERNYESFSELEEKKKKTLQGLNSRQLQIISMGQPPSISINKRQESMRQELMSRGFTNENFIELQLQALDDAVYNKHRRQIKQLMRIKDYGSALRILEEILTEIPDKNLLLLTEVLQQAAEVALFKGDLKAFQTYTNQYYQSSEKIIAIYKDSKLSTHFAAREKLHKLANSLTKAKQGGLFHFLQNIREQKITPTEIMLALKSNARQHNNDSPFAIKNSDIEAAANAANPLFQTLRK